MKKRIHTDSRLSENFTLQGLQSLTGQKPYDWLKYVVKELVDNSLEASQNPEIKITARVEGEKIIKLKIEDNGPGIEKEQIHKIFGDINNFAGTKRHYKLPTRGCQGNALMTILGIQNLFHKPLRVHSHESFYTIKVVKKDLSGNHEAKVDQKEAEYLPGLGVYLDFTSKGPDIGGLGDLVQAVCQFAELNPQASFYLTIQNENEKSKKIMFKGNGKTGRRLKLSQRTTTGKVIWFNENDFFNRVSADARVAPQLKLKDFVQEFHGLSSSQKVRKVLEELGYDRESKLTDLFDAEGNLREDMARDLYNAMKKHTTSFDEKNLANTLGSIGKEGMRHALLQCLKLFGWNNYLKEIVDFSHQMKLGIKDIDDLIIYQAKGDISRAGKTIPHYFEVIVVPLDWKKRTAQDKFVHVNFGINQSFVYSQPRVQLLVKNRKGERSYSSIQETLKVFDYSFKVVCNLMCPNVDFQDKGKQSFDTRPFAGTISELMGKVVRKIERDIVPVLNKMNKSCDDIQEETELPGKAPQGFIKEFVINNFKSVYREATDGGKHILTQRQFFYAMRKKFFAQAESKGYKWSCRSKPGKLVPLDLNYGTFQEYVNEFEVDHLGKRVIYKKDRGFFIEPHSNKQVGLGTTEVENYVVPSREFNNILIVEKTGYHQILHYDFKITKRYDMALINLEGYGNNATRDLVENILKENPKVRIFVLTDFDIAGLGIAKNIKKPDELSAADMFECERIGITLEDIEQNNLPPEPVTYKKKELKELENRYNKGDIPESVYKFLKKGQRVEINVFTPVELKEYLEKKFKKLGIEKLKPKSKDEVKTHKVPSPKEIFTRTVQEAIGEFVVKSCRQELLDFLEKNIELEDESEDAQRSLQDISKGQREIIYQKVLDELATYPPKNWLAINQQIIEELKSDAERIEKRYELKVREKVMKILEEQVTIEVKFKNEKNNHQSS